MKKLTAFILATFLFMFMSLSAQTPEKCGTMENDRELSKNNPDAILRKLQLEKAASKWLKENKNTKMLDSALITIPVVFHIVYNTPAQNIDDSLIYSQLEVINNDYRRTNADTVNTRPVFDSIAVDTRIEFCLANVDPQGNFTTGINRVQTATTGFATSPFDNAVKSSATGGVDPWPTSDYLNIWICDMYFFGNPFVLGYAQFPGGDTLTDGLVFTYQHTGYRPWDAAASPANLGRTASHEAGHYLGLFHIWGDGDCTASDSVTDTPNAAAASQQICTLTNNTCDDSSNPYWNGFDPPDMLENYMDYSTDACMNMFSQGQSDRMWSFINTARASLLTSTKCDGATGIADGLKSSSIIVYPNPSNGKFIFEWPGEHKFNNIKVIDLLGKAILSKDISNAYAKYELNLDNFKDGVYFVQLSNDNNSIIKRVIIAH